MNNGHKNDLLGIFAHHRVACNLLMAMMLMSGVWALLKLNTQFFPTFALDFVVVTITWTGASAEDVETSITNPIERELRTLDNLRKMTSTSAEGLSTIVLEYESGTDMGLASDQVKERVALIRNLPVRAEDPEIIRVVNYEPVARVLVTGAGAASELRAVAHQMEAELLERGIAKVFIEGLPEEEIALQVPSRALRDLDLSLVDIAARVASRSRDLPAGSVGRNDISRQLRALGQRRSELEFADVALISDATGRLVTLGDVATIERRARSRQTRVFHRGKPAVELQLSRSDYGDSLGSARIIQDWLAQTRSQWPASIEIRLYDEAWRLIRERIMLLLKNGGGGLVLVILILFLFLNGRVAWWVAWGIPVSFMAALGALYAFGGSINMVSLFALIMALGIIVDDAIVVGEDALAHYQAGEEPLRASEGGARRMLAPVLSSSLTTVAAFLPLMAVGGIIGNILFDIPLVVVCVIIASLMESFLVLPGHLRHSFQHLHPQRVSRLRRHLDAGFVAFRERAFRPSVRHAIANPWLTVCAATALFLLALGLVAGGRVAFNFFPSPEASVIRANVTFVAGTAPLRVKAFLDDMEAALVEAERSFDEPVVKHAVQHLGKIVVIEGQESQSGDQFGTIWVELTEPDTRSVRNQQLIDAWRSRVKLPAGIESVSIIERRGGPPGRDIDIRLIGANAASLKAAALELADALGAIPGVSGIEDDMPFGQEQLIYELTAEGKALGLTVEEVGRQLRAAYDGQVAQIFQDGDDEVEVRVMLPDRERHQLASLQQFSIQVPNGRAVPLLSVVRTHTRRGFDTLRHTGGKLSLRISADVDPALNNNNAVIAQLQASTLPALSTAHGVDYAFEGRQADQTETLADMRRGGLFALAMIYLVLAWVFASYGLPLVVMAAIPFGLTGALFGHWLLGIDLTILSLFGLFGLAGIVVNDSIILVTFFKQTRRTQRTLSEAIVEAACQRLRAVLLTSLTTIAGLTPLMFETSLQAQFLIPMAVSISFGLAFATLLVLLVIPALLYIHELAAKRMNLVFRGTGQGALQSREDSSI